MTLLNWAHKSKCIDHTCTPDPAPPPSQFNSLDECVNVANRERVAIALVQRHPDQRRVRVVWPAGQPGASAVSASFLERYCSRAVG